MPMPEFFARVPRLRVHDPLAEALGSAEGGILEYGYEDAVRLAGHSCPTVASAYWLTLRALQLLYPEGLPQRGGVRVELREDPRDGTAGVTATVVQMLTGAAGEWGFKGLAGRHRRAGLQTVSPDLPLAMRFVRLDNRKAVDAGTDLSLLPADPRLEALAQRCMLGRATRDEWAQLAELWQLRVQRLLLELAYDDGVFVLQPASRPWGSPPAPRAMPPCPPPLRTVVPRYSQFGALG